MIKLSVQSFFKMMIQKQYWVEPDGVNILGVRLTTSRPNYFDDTITVYTTKLGSWKEFHFAATTLPGVPFLLKPVNPKGTAILVPGQYRNAYSIGLHKGRYPALVQTSPVKVYRDNNLDNVFNKETITVQSGLFGINIHRASFGAKIVEVDSAGCQVIQKYSDFEDFMELCRLSHQQKFNYTLIEVSSDA